VTANRERKTRVRASAVVEADGELLLVRLRDPASGALAFYPPGGGIDEGEAPWEAARRETLEETGLRVEVDPASELVATYPFVWNATDYDVTTHFFHATTSERELGPVEDADYHRGAKWLPLLEALDELAVNPAIAAPVARLLDARRRPAWEAHPRFGGPAATLLAIHDQFRMAARRVVDEPQFFRPLADVLHHHHHAEEAMLFPFIGEHTGKAPARLVDDHATLTAAIDAAAKEPSKENLARFAAVLVAHLDREELEVVPVLLSVDPQEAWARIHGG
jgi:8-oxo-dGTP pyrophosphatase MutT (NUDIX family)